MYTGTFLNFENNLMTYLKNDAVRIVIKRMKTHEIIKIKKWNFFHDRPRVHTVQV